MRMLFRGERNEYGEREGERPSAIRPIWTHATCSLMLKGPGLRNAHSFPLDAFGSIMCQSWPSKWAMTRMKSPLTVKPEGLRK